MRLLLTLLVVVIAFTALAPYATSVVAGCGPSCEYECVNMKMLCSIGEFYANGYSTSGYNPSCGNCIGECACDIYAGLCLGSPECAPWDTPSNSWTVPPPPGSYCGDGICQSTESWLECEEDCGFALCVNDFSGDVQNFVGPIGGGGGNPYYNAQGIMTMNAGSLNVWYAGFNGWVASFDFGIDYVMTNPFCPSDLAPPGTQDTGRITDNYYDDIYDNAKGTGVIYDVTYDYVEGYYVGGSCAFGSCLNGVVNGPMSYSHSGPDPWYDPISRFSGIPYKSECIPGSCGALDAAASWGGCTGSDYYIISTTVTPVFTRDRLQYWAQPVFSSSVLGGVTAGSVNICGSSTNPPSACCSCTATNGAAQAGVPCCNGNANKEGGGCCLPGTVWDGSACIGPCQTDSNWQGTCMGKNGPTSVSGTACTCCGGLVPDVGTGQCQPLNCGQNAGTEGQTCGSQVTGPGVNGYYCTNNNLQRFELTPANDLDGRCCPVGDYWNGVACMSSVECNQVQVGWCGAKANTFGIGNFLTFMQDPICVGVAGTANKPAGLSACGDYTPPAFTGVSPFYWWTDWVGSLEGAQTY